MPAHKKEKILCICKNCQAEVYKAPAKAKLFKFCSNNCKSIAKKKQIPANKLPLSKRIFVKCTLETCNQGKYLRPKQALKNKKRFCSNKCKGHYHSFKYREELEQLKQKKQEAMKRSIWFLGNK